MNEEQIPLTPAEQMRRIREAVLAETAKEASAILAASLSRQDVLREHVADLESKMLLRERPFVSRVVLIGPVIAWVRSLWNWMSTKWYVLPLIRQQNEFNMAVAQTLREIVASLESLTNLTRDVQMRVADLEASMSSQVEESQERRLDARWD
jgi:hypothetical protein